MKALLSPLVEAVIALDRVLFIAESNFSCQIIEIFEKSKSPRNYLIYAKK